MTTAIFHAMFYCHLQPFILFVAFFNMNIFQANMKYMMLRRCKIPELTDIQVFNFALFGISFGPLFYGLGSLFFLFMDDKQLTVWEALPSVFCLLAWFSGTMNLFSIPEKMIKNLLKYMNAHPEEPTRDNVRAQSLGKSIFFNSDFFKNKFWRRR